MKNIRSNLVSVMHMQFMEGIKLKLQESCDRKLYAALNYDIRHLILEGTVRPLIRNLDLQFNIFQNHEKYKL